MSSKFKTKTTPAAWVGEWDISIHSNPDHMAKLLIKESKADCVTPPWCNLIVILEEETGKKQCEIKKMDKDFRRTFIVSKDKTRIDAEFVKGDDEIVGHIALPSIGKRAERFHGVKE